jgi:hypothetical protein
MYNIVFEKKIIIGRTTCLHTSFESSASILRSGLGFTAASFMERNCTTDKKTNKYVKLEYTDEWKNKISRT